MNQPASRATPDGPATNRLVSWYVVAVLILAYTCSYVDRTILTLLVKPIRATLQITDVQISLLHGLAFAVFYTLLGIPIARLADRHNRTRIILAGVVVWSLMTAVCGAARNFWQLFLARIGVGVGEAALSPAAYSMISDYFKGSALARALSVYTSAIYVGAGLAMIVGGAVIASVSAMELPVIGHVEPWQVVFFMVGALGLPVALLMLTVREPVRTGLATGAGAEGIPFRGVLRWMNERRGAYWLMIVGYSVLSLVWNGSAAWIPSFFIRNFGWSAAQVGYRFGFIVLIFGTVGIITGGLISTWLRHRGKTDSNISVGVLAALLALPTGALAPLSSDPIICLMIYAGFVFACSLPYGCAAAAFQEITPNQMRAQVTAVYFLVLNLAGIGLGSTVVALITERVFGDDAAVKLSLALVALIAAPLAALILWWSRAPYMRCFAEQNPDNGAGARLR